MSVSTAFISALGLVLVALISFLGARLASRDTRDATRETQAVVALIDERKVSREDFDSITRELRASLADVRAELAEEHNARRASDERAVAAERAREEAERAREEAEALAAGIVGKLTRRVAQLEEVLRAHDMPVPPVAD